MNKYTGPNNLDSSSSKADLKARVCSPTTCLSAHRKGFIDRQCHKNKINPYVSAKSEKDKVLIFNTVAIAPKARQTAILKFPVKCLITGNDVN